MPYNSASTSRRWRWTRNKLLACVAGVRESVLDLEVGKAYFAVIWTPFGRRCAGRYKGAI